MNKPVNHAAITPFLWFDTQAEEAIHFYVSVFPDSGIKLLKKWPEHTPFPQEATKPGTVQEGIFTLAGCQFHAFDAGPLFRFNPSVSFFTVLETEKEIDVIWDKLSAGGQILMPLKAYEWSDYYGWVSDRYGISWQLMKASLPEFGRRITPLLMFSGDQRGKAAEAINFYTRLFGGSGTDSLSRYGKDDAAPEGMIKHGRFRLSGQHFMAMDNGTEQDIPFTEAISFFVHCRDQEQVDYFWDGFSDRGKESPCGWVKDPFGVSWQIVPDYLSEKLVEEGNGNTLALMKAMSRMKKLDVKALQAAYES